MGCSASTSTHAALGPSKLSKDDPTQPSTSSIASGNASNLSSFGSESLDVVVALTQIAIDAQMKSFLYAHPSQQERHCYIYTTTGALEEIDYDELVLKAGADPFELPDGANEENEQVRKLAEVGFAGAFKATGGLPPVPIDEYPALIVLGEHTNSPVQYTLTCSEFQVVGIRYIGFRAVAINQSQPSGPGAKPWYYLYNVDLTQVAIDPNAELPEAVVAQMDSLIHEVGVGAFGVQRLLLNLNTLLLTAQPYVPDVSDNEAFSPVWQLMSSVFASAYFNQMRQTGEPVFSYSFTVDEPIATSTLSLETMQLATSPFLVANQATSSPASCLTYLCTTASTPPPLQGFPWNWVALEDVSQIAGVIAVRRSQFVSYMQGLLSVPGVRLCWDTNVRMDSHTWSVTIYNPWVTMSSSPTSFVVVDPPEQQADGSWLVLTMQYGWIRKSANAHDSLKTLQVHMEYDIVVYGRVYLQGKTILITAQTVAQMEFDHTEAWLGKYTDLPKKNYYDKTLHLTYSLGVTAAGQLEAVESKSIVDSSVPFVFSPKGLISLTDGDDLKRGLESSAQHLNSSLDSHMWAFASGLTSALNGYSQWVFPGVESFAATNAFFSEYGDLITQVNYTQVGTSLLLLPAPAPEVPPQPDFNKKEDARSYKITGSAELMTNFVQSDILAPQKSFKALQTSQGASLLFAIGTDGEFRVVVEDPGQEAHGWVVRNLSSKVMETHFPGAEAKVSTFGAAQYEDAAATHRAIQLAMSIEVDGESHLFVSTNNSDSDLSWTEDINWVRAPFNAHVTVEKLVIVGIRVSSTLSGNFFVVDILRDPNHALQLISRWWVNMRYNVPNWEQHNVAADFEAGSYDSVLGRARNQMVDGVYTVGKVGEAAQMVYAPLYNPFNYSAPVSVMRFYLPNGLVPDAIAAARHGSGDGESDLFIASTGGVYHLASANQKDGAVASLVASDALLYGVTKLFAAEEGDMLALWGLNGSNQVFYLECDVSEVADPTAWSVPYPILKGVDAVSPYLDRKFVANTFFAHAADGLLKHTKTPSTGLWTREPIRLPPSETLQDSYEVESFTTRLTVIDTETGEAAPGVVVQITATSVTAVSINYLYYLVGPQPISVQTDEEGTITIVEVTSALVATRFQATVATTAALAATRVGTSASVDMDPMGQAMARNSALDSVDKLKAAKITAMDGTQTDFVPADTPTGELQRVADSNLKLSAASQSVVTGRPLSFGRRGYRGHRYLRRSTQPAFQEAHLKGVTFKLSDVGDLFMWLATGVEAFIDIAKDVSSGVWNFVCNIAGEWFSAVLSDLEAIGAAVVWVYNKTIGVVVGKVLQLLMFLFGWQDIVVTHRVMKRFVLLVTEDFNSKLTAAKADFVHTMAEAKKHLQDFASIPTLVETPAETLNNDGRKDDSATGNLGNHHYKGNASKQKAVEDEREEAPSVLEALVALAEGAEATVAGASERLRVEVVDQFSSLSLDEILIRIMGILGVGLLDAVEAVGVELFDVAVHMPSMMDLLDAPLHIPVLSWLYKKLTGDQLTILDLVCLLAAIPGTIAAKAAIGRAPYSLDDPVTQRMLYATSIQEWNNAPYDVLTSKRANLGKAVPPEVALADEKKVEEQKAIQALELGFVCLGGTLVRVLSKHQRLQLQTLEATAPSVLLRKLISQFATTEWIGTVCADAQSFNLETYENVVDTSVWYKQMGSILNVFGKFRVFTAIFFVNTKSSAIKMTFALVASVENLLKMVPTILAPILGAATWTPVLIMKTTGKLANCLAGVLQFPIYLAPKGSNTYTVLLGSEYLFRFAYGTLMVAWPAYWLIRIELGDPAAEVKIKPIERWGPMALEARV